MSTPLRLLILEDRPADAELMLHELRQAGFEPDWQRVETKVQYLAQLHQDLDVILADYALPQFDALHALYLLQERGLDIPFIIVSGRISEEVAVDCIKQGVADYLLKDRLARLGPAVAHALQEKKLRDEKRRAEAALRESELQYRTTIDSMGDAIHVVDTDLRFILLNTALKQWNKELGLETDMIGLTIFEVFPFLPDRVRDEYHQVFETGKTLITEESTQVGDSEFITETRKIPVFEGGRVARVVTVIRDITERKRAEEALQDSEARYRAIVEDQTELVCRFLPDETLTFVNEAYCRYFGRQREELIGQSFMPLILGEDREFVQKKIASLSSENPIVTHEHRVVMPNGEIGWQQWTNRAILDEQGRLIEFQAVGRDITERKGAEEALKESMEKIKQAKQEWESTADSLASLVCLLDDRGRIIRANRTVEHWNLGRVAEVKGQRLHELLHPICTDPACYLETFWSQAWEELAQGRPTECEAEDRVLKRHFSVQVRPVLAQTAREGKKAVSFAVAIVHDITERKQAEEQLKTSLKEKEVLLKEIHHRVKNNLQIISSLLKLQSEYIQDEQMLRMFRESQNRVKSMALIHEKLYQSKDLVKLDLVEYIRNLAAYLFRSYGVDSYAISLQIEVDNVSLGIDTAIPCGLIINELVSNSLKHAFPASREGEIRIALRSDRDNQFTLIVSDNGVGLPRDLDFLKTESLGLQLVNMLVHQLEGAIELDRSGGTAFKITFEEPEEKS